MTIYALVNNLIKGKTSDSVSPAIWTLISSAGILQGGNPYFVPDFAKRFEARLALAVRIGKLGKGVAPRFVSRYAEAIAPCVVFVASDLLEDLRMKGLPWTQAVNYDKCTALGKFVAIPYEETGNCKVELRLETPTGESSYGWDKSEMNPGIGDSISELSRDNTLKTGDIVLIGLSADGPAVSPGERASLLLNGIPSLRFNIR